MDGWASRHLQFRCGRRRSCDHILLRPRWQYLHRRGYNPRQQWQFRLLQYRHTQPRHIYLTHRGHLAGRLSVRCRRQHIEREYQYQITNRLNPSIWNSLLVISPLVVIMVTTRGDFPFKLFANQGTMETVIYLLLMYNFI